MTVKLYKSDLSPPARAVMMTLDILEVPYEAIEISLPNRDHFSPEFIKKNPLHTIPVLEDGDFIIHDSHAIMMYLVDKYGKDDEFYPKDLTKRTLVNQKLFFDTGILFTRLKSVINSVFYEAATTLSEKHLRDIHEVYGFLEDFLSRTKYLAGDTITIADISSISYTTTLIYVVSIDAAKECIGKETIPHILRSREKKISRTSLHKAGIALKYPKTAAWIKDLEQRPYCRKHNAAGAARLGVHLRQAFN